MGFSTRLDKDRLRIAPHYTRRLFPRGLPLIIGGVGSALFGIGALTFSALYMANAESHVCTPIYGQTIWPTHTARDCSAMHSPKWPRLQTHGDKPDGKALVELRRRPRHPFCPQCHRSTPQHVRPGHYGRTDGPAEPVGPSRGRHGQSDSQDRTDREEPRHGAAREPPFGLAAIRGDIGCYKSGIGHNPPRAPGR